VIGCTGVEVLVGIDGVGWSSSKRNRWLLILLIPVVIVVLALWCNVIDTSTDLALWVIVAASRRTARATTSRAATGAATIATTTIPTGGIVGHVTIA
jgi:hypothetical protein